MQELCSNETTYGHESEAFSNIQIPPKIPFFVRLDGWKFRKLADKLETEKPFDRRFAQCLVESAKALFRAGMNPTLVYVASDELNILFTASVPFNGRVEKINSVLAGIVSSVFSIRTNFTFGKQAIIAFDSRIVLTPKKEMIAEYLSWRQINLWRNHNNAYAYWKLRRKGYKPSEIAKKLQRLKANVLHELLFQEGVNLAKTPTWQRRGILVYKRPYVKQVTNHRIIRWRITEDWDLPLFTTENGKTLLNKILQWNQIKRKHKIRRKQ